MSIHHRALPLAGQLLVQVATGAPLDPAWCREEDEAARQFQWVLDGDLGPLLNRAALPYLGQLPPPWRAALQSADLTARVTHADRVETALEVVERCAERHIPAVLLKAISVGEQLYPAEHLRPMTDIDVLVPQEAYAGLEQTLLARGYARLEHLAVPGHHHGAPLRRPRLRTVVELHARLFPHASPGRIRASSPGPSMRPTCWPRGAGRSTGAACLAPSTTTGRGPRCTSWSCTCRATASSRRRRPPWHGWPLSSGWSGRCSFG